MLAHNPTTIDIQTRDRDIARYRHLRFQMSRPHFFVNLLMLVSVCLNQCFGDDLMQYRKLRGSFTPNFSRSKSIKQTALNPWPYKQDDDENLCKIVNERKLRVIIIMGSDRGYHERTKRCMKVDSDPVSVNTRYADLNQYALRMYIDDDIPFIMKHQKNALEGELRKIFAMADVCHPNGPKHGFWTTKVHETKPDLVMWVDGDATLYSNKQATLTVEEVILRTCKRAEYPSNYVRFVAQDSVGSVNAGWYIISAGEFGLHFLSYLLELSVIYEPCAMWGQNMIQEALLVVMAGTPPPWSFVLPCSGEKLDCFKNSSFNLIKHECNHSKECVIEKSATFTNTTNYHKLIKSAGGLNGCFSQQKYEFVPNGVDNWQRSQIAINTQRAKGIETSAGCENICCAYNTYPSPACNTGGLNHSNKEEMDNFEKNHTLWWAASGAGVVLLPGGDPEVKFNILKFHTEFLWHHGHGKLFSTSCV